MKGRIIKIAVLLYTIVVFISVFGILLVIFKYEFSWVFDFTPLSFFDGAKKIFMVTFLQAQHEFPHLGVPLVVGYHCLFIAMSIIICNLFLKKYFKKKCSSFLSSYSSNSFDKKNMQYTFVAISIGWIFCLFIIEGSLRYLGVYKTGFEKSGGNYVSPYQSLTDTWFWNYPPLAQHKLVVPEFSQMQKANSKGFVDHEWSPKKKLGFRLACIGDSFTEGIGALSFDSSYPSLLRNMLSNCEVMNWGIGGSDPVFGEMLLEQKIVSYHPDIVTFTINQSDLNEMAIRGGRERFHADSTTHFRKAPPWEWLYGSSYIVRIIAHQMLCFDSDLHLPKSQVEKERLYVMRVIRECIDTFHEVCLKNKIRPIIIFHPFKREVIQGHMDFEQIIFYSKSKNYEYIDMLSYFQRRGVTPMNITNYYWHLDTHNNANGYKLFAEGIYDYLTLSPRYFTKEKQSVPIQ